MLSLLFRLLAAKDVIKTVADAARIAKSARDIVVETRQGPRNLPQRAPEREAVDKLFADVARLETLVVEQAKVVEQTAGEIARLAMQVRRAALQAVLALGAGIVALVLAIVALARA